MMRRFSIRLAVALVTFVIGLQLAWLVATFFAPAVTRQEVQGSYSAPPAGRKRSCPTERRSAVHTERSVQAAAPQRVEK